MEKEIAGKILLCLRAPSAEIQEDPPPSSVVAGPTNSTERKENLNANIEQDNTISFNIGFSFTQFLAQSVDGSAGINLDDLEEYNCNVLRTRKEINSSCNNLWNKCCTFFKEYHHSETEVENLLTELKTDVSSITGISDVYESEKATLIVFNLYYREKTSTGRKEELQRIFNITDFNNIRKISNTINELLKPLSPCLQEDFIRRWNEVFRDRVEAIENQFVSKAEMSNNKGCNHFPSKEKLSKLESWKMLKSIPNSKLDFFREIVLIDEVIDRDMNFNVSVAVDEHLKTGDLDDDSVVVRIDLSAPCNKINDNTVLSNRIKRAKLACRVSQDFQCHKFSRKDAAKILLEKLKYSLRKKSRHTEGNSSHLRSKRLRGATTVSCLNQFVFQDDEPKARNDITGKNWIEKQLKNALPRVVWDCINYRIVVLAMIDLLSSEKTDYELESLFLDIFGLANINLVRTLLGERGKIVEHCRSSNQKKGIQVLHEMELEKLKDLIVQQKESHSIQTVSSDFKNFRTSKLSEVEIKTKMQDRLSKAKKDECPHIFDSNQEMKLSSSFVNASKIMLPQEHVRKDTKTYEEIYLPIKMNLTNSIGVKETPVLVSSLDEIGQTVFFGIESLNRIQSIVFPTAYYSNENLLICAPTGAGKTNVALLTIVHEIQQNIENGIIRKDQFKIVYVAPMKALAAEMTANFSRRLKDLNLVVKELTGDMQLSKSEIAATQLLVTTPEKWDLVTRKGDGDTTLSSLVKLLIIDEVHLLHSDRGPVIEALVARTLRQVETSQKMIRIVGLSATLPNYKDVATFLRVNHSTGLFFFDSRFRPVPLSQCFVGVKGKKPAQQVIEMNQVCYDKILQTIKQDMQVMIFVHARNSTVKTAMTMREMASQKGQLALFAPSESKLANAKRIFERAKAKQLHDLLPFGFGIHHAGLLRHDRSLVEECFSRGLIKVLVCTSTLAWGVNLPAHAVIIKGTELYDAKHGSFVDLGILDVLQIFGRAGRPQFNESGDGIIITTHSKLHHYLALMMNQFPIESRFITYLADNLNAEITLGTITNIGEAIEWLSYTYLFVRMRINPQEYGINYTDVERDCTLFDKRKELIENAAMILDKLQMVRYNEETGKLSPTDLGRTASLFYVKYDTIETFNEQLQNVMNEAETLNMLSQAHEFEQLKVRDDEMDDLDILQNENCEYVPAGGSENIHGKVNILLQTYLSRGEVKSFSLISDLAYIAQNASRIMRALFDIVLRRNNPMLSGRFLQISQMFERRLWYFETPLRQFNNIPRDIIDKIEQRDTSIERLREMDAKEIGIVLKHAKMGQLVKKCAEEFPMLKLNAMIQPITRAVLRVKLLITGDFVWNDKVHGRATEPFWIWVEDPESNFMYHSEYFFLTRKQVLKGETQEVAFTIPVHEPLPSQYVIRVPSDRWFGSVSVVSVALKDVILPELHHVQTELLPLQPLPVSALQNPEYESLYKFTHFNPIQTQIFHCLYYTDNNVLLGAPTGSGKTIIAEIAFFRVFRSDPDAKIVYIAPLKALVKERIRDWKIRFEKKLKKSVVELTGDVTPDIQAISSASIIVTTPEKWDSISRSWQTRNYVRKVVLIVIDEIHLLGEDRGPVLEVIVSRTNFISSRTQQRIRIVGLSTALANAQDLANWLKITETGLYNFRPSVRPVPLEVHIQAFPGKYYCPRMATMNKPAFQAIQQYSPSQPVLIFVSSRRQTRLTAMDLLAHLASENNPKQWLRLKDSKMNKILETIKDDNLKVILGFGIGLHHAGLQESDRKTVEELFEHQHIQVLIATSTLAWGVNFPAHLVIIKGTEYFDCKSHRYVDMPITDILQMMGRAGRPQFDKQGIAVVMVHDVKKNFYKKFLYEPFPVESNLLAVLPDHLNAEVVAGTISTGQNAIDYLTWTYFFRRLLENPAFYHASSVTPDDINTYLTNVIAAAVKTLENSQCIVIDDDGRTLHPTCMGRIASYYYIKHETMLHFKRTLKPDLTIADLLEILSDVTEYNDVPVRHNEEHLNADLAKYCKIKVDESKYDSPHTKTHLLFQAHFSRLILPCVDYHTDLKMVLDNAIRILQAIIDVCGEYGYLASTLRAQQLMQMIIQGRWITDHPLLTLPHIEYRHLYLFMHNSEPPFSLPALNKLVNNKYGELLNMLQQEFTETEINKIYEILINLPKIKVEISLSESVKETKTEQEENVSISSMVIDPKIPIGVKVNSEYVIHLKLTKLNRQKDLRVYAPHFPKPKDESWFLILGVPKTKELLALKRFTFGRRKEVFHNFMFQVPDYKGIASVSVYLMSDSYMGLDQQYNILFDIIK